MAKQFKDKKEFNEWIESKKTLTFEAVLNGTQEPSDEEYIEMLKKEGYTDLENLTENGEGYSFCGYTNR